MMFKTTDLAAIETSTSALGFCIVLGVGLGRR